MGFINAGRIGSVAARMIIVIIAMPNIRQCGRT
jgi:hypothetical protein